MNRLNLGNENRYDFLGDHGFQFDSKFTTQVHGEIFLEASDTQITVGWEMISKD